MYEQWDEDLNTLALKVLLKTMAKLIQYVSLLIHLIWLA